MPSLLKTKGVNTFPLVIWNDFQGVPNNEATTGTQNDLYLRRNMLIYVLFNIYIIYLQGIWGYFVL